MTKLSKASLIILCVTTILSISTLALSWFWHYGDSGLYPNGKWSSSQTSISTYMYPEWQVHYVRAGVGTTANPYLSASSEGWATFNPTFQRSEAFTRATGGNVFQTAYAFYGR